MSKTVNGVDVSAYVMKLSGKEYLQVQGRLVLLRALHPDWSIQTELVKLENNNTPEDFAMFKAIILDGAGSVMATAYGSETRKGFPTGHIEKAETISVGRALLFAGIGIQYAEKGTEEDGAAKLADSQIAAKVQRLNGGKSPEGLPGGSTADQQKQIGTLIKELGWNSTGAVGWLDKHFQVKTRAELNKVQALLALVDLVNRVDCQEKPPSQEAKAIIEAVTANPNYSTLLAQVEALGQSEGAA